MNGLHLIENLPDVSKSNIGRSVTIVNALSKLDFAVWMVGPIATKRYLRYSIHVHDCFAHQISQLRAYTTGSVAASNAISTGGK